MAKRATSRQVAKDAVKLRSNPARQKRAADGLENLISGLGTEKDKMFNTHFTLMPLDIAQLDAAYRGDWIARKLVDIPAADATREWRSWQGIEIDMIGVLEGEEQRLNLQQKMKQGLQKARLYGGGALILGIDQGRNEDPVDLERVTEGQLSFVHAVSRYDMAEGQMDDDVMSPWYGEASYYDIHGNKGSTRFHPSRVVPFRGMSRQDHSSKSEIWGDSVIQTVGDAIKAAGLVSASVAQLVAEAKIEVIKVPLLSENMATVGYENNLIRRFGLANVIKSVHSMLLIDKEEDWERHNASFASLPEILQMYFLLVCGAADIPATRFFGQSPAGLSATGDSDIRNYYDAVASTQKNDISPLLWRLDEVLMRSAFGTRPDECFYVWNPLWQMTEEQRVKIAKEKADVVKLDVDAGLIDSVVLKKSRENQLVEDAFYPGFEQALEEFDGMGEENIEEEVDEPGEEGDLEETEEGTPPELETEETEGKEARAKDARPKRRAFWRKRDRRTKMRTGDQIAALRKRFNDARPRTLYIHRKVINSAAIVAWAREQGFTSMILPDDLHVTIVYSKAEVDWIKIGEDGYGQNEKGIVRIPPGGPRVIEKFGKATCLVFASSALSWRHESSKYRGASSDYEDYNPHITITYSGMPEDLSTIEPYQGEIILGPEVFAEIKTGFNNNVDVPEQILDGSKPKEKEVEVEAKPPEPNLGDQIAQAIAKIPPPVVNVTIAKGGKEVTHITHDDKGRIAKLEKVEE